MQRHKSQCSGEKATLSREICPEMHVNEIRLPQNRHHEVSSSMNSTKTHKYMKMYKSPVGHEVL